MTSLFKRHAHQRLILVVFTFLILLTAFPVMAQSTTDLANSALSKLTGGEKAALAPSKEDLKKAHESGKRLTLPQAIRDSIEMTQSGYSELDKGIKYVSEGFRIAPQEMEKALDNLAEGQGAARLFHILAAVLFIYGAGLAVEFAIRRITLKIRSKVEARHAGNLFRRLINDLILTGFEFGYFAVFLYTTINILAMFSPHDNITLVAGGFLVPITRARIGVLILRFIFSPLSDESRLIPISRYAAKQITFWGTLTLILSPLTGRMILTLSTMGMSDETTAALFMLEILIPTVLLLMLIWRNKKELRNYILEKSTNAEPGTFAYWLAYNWHRAATAYLLILIIMRQVSLLQGKEMAGALLLSLISVPAAILLDMTLLAALENIITKKNKPAEDAGQKPQDPIYIRQIHSGLRTILGAGLVLYLFEVWGISFNLGHALSQGALSIFVTVLLSYLLWEYLCGLIDNQFESHDEEADELAEMGKGGSRKNTLLTLLKKFLTLSIITISSLIVLTSIGVNIAPIIAGAGIFGLAVGFGAQTLVKDVLSGVFFLIDDAFRIGDYVESGRLKGTVERISVRSISLRHSRGQVQIIPYGSLGSVTNFSRDWVAMKLEVRVPFDVDPEKVRKIIKKMGKKIAADEDLGPLLLTPIKSQGVKEIDDSSLVIRIKFRCRPGDQFSLRKEVFSRVREDFAANGIEFAPKKVTVHVPNIENAVLTKEQLTTIAAAAAETGLAASEQEKDE
ncbi:mechanosensitive ion channel domain-containing protein [Maridesulfovibrio sp.]|uniref:mechanosensitive ion channel family protein n=1 Tax=Maridesulfovibrio sp. TaxID=2795000 RepID=UPI0029CA61C2|nr:mechanosensitive ion channel domain-containing protein [Maridesulfovibrio sp.]